MIATARRPARLAVLVSGGGSNLQAIIDAIQSGGLNAEIVVVASNRKSAYGLVRAQNANVPRLYFPMKPYTDGGLSREDYDRDLAARIAAYQPDWVVLAGWMHVFTPAFLDAFPNRVINLHPALPGVMPGTEAIRRTFEAYEQGALAHGGCMVHFVISEIDAGEVIAQADVPILPDDTLDDFEIRLHHTEHRLIVDALRKVTTRA